MKAGKTGVFLLAIHLMQVFSPTPVSAQAPASIAGDAINVTVTSGFGPFSSVDYLFLPANSGSGYQLIGPFGVGADSGTYSYSSSNAVGIINFADAAVGAATGTVNFISS